MKLKYIKDAWLIIGVVLLSLIFTEIVVSLISYAKSHLRSLDLSPTIDLRSQADVYRDSHWVKDYFQEMGESFQTNWTSYVYWRRKPFKGKYININDKGHRITILPNKNLNEINTPYKIFMFGGSTLWGTGARDQYTIPSILTKCLAEKGIDATIVNFAENGYVSSQEVIELMLQLQNESIPDMVIFYDGVNDVFSAYQNNAAGLPQNEENRIKEFNLTKKRNLDKLTWIIIQEKLKRLSISRLANYTRLKFSDHFDEALPNQKGKRVFVDNLNEQILKIYFNNMKIVNALGQVYGFKCLFYWQPTVFTKKMLTDYEKKVLAAKKNLKKLFDITYDSVDTLKLKFKQNNFNNISRIFENYSEPLYIDFCHISELGNQMVAEKMADDVKAIFDIYENN